MLFVFVVILCYCVGGMFCCGWLLIIRLIEIGIFMFVLKVCYLMVVGLVLLVVWFVGVYVGVVE